MKPLLLNFIKSSLALAFILLLSFQPLNGNACKRKKKSTMKSFQAIYNKEKQKLFKHKEYNYNLPTIYVENWCLGAPTDSIHPIEMQRRRDSARRINYRLKELNCDCYQAAGKTEYETYRECDIKETRGRLVDLTNIIFMKLYYDSMNYPMPPESSLGRLSGEEKEVYNVYRQRVIQEIGRLQW